MNYWLDLFTWNTWQEFMNAGGTISGFRKSRWKIVQKMKKGDILLCYMTGISRFFAILEVTGNAFQDNQPIWGEEDFPTRIPVKVLLHLSPEYAVPVKSLRSSLSYFEEMKSKNSWSGYFRSSPASVKIQDAEVIISALEEAEQEPISREFDSRKLERKSNVYNTKSGKVSIPDDIEEEEVKYPPLEAVAFHIAPRRRAHTNSS